MRHDVVVVPFYAEIKLEMTKDKYVHKFGIRLTSIHLASGHPLTLNKNDKKKERKKSKIHRMRIFGMCEKKGGQKSELKLI